MPKKKYTHPPSPRYRSLLETVDAWRTQGAEVSRYRVWSEMNDTAAISKPVVYSMAKTLLRDGLLGDDALGLHLLTPAREWLAVTSYPIPAPPEPKPIEPLPTEALEAAIWAANEKGVLLELHPASNAQRTALTALELTGAVYKVPYDAVLRTNAGYVCKGSPLVKTLLTRISRRPASRITGPLTATLEAMQ